MRSDSHFPAAPKPLELALALSAFPVEDHIDLQQVLDVLHRASVTAWRESEALVAIDWDTWKERRPSRTGFAETVS